MKYKLTNPNKLFRFLEILVIIIIAVFILTKCKGSKGEEATAEESQTGSGRIETFSIDNYQQESQGTIRSVSSITLEGINAQLSTYMSAMLVSNLDNVKTSMTNYMYENDPLAGYDPTLYSYIVAINPARGGTDKGHTAGNVYEKDITLEVGKALLQYLNEHNDGKYYFYLTRDADTAMTDGARVASATSHQADMMITLCCNGSEEELGGTIGVSYDRAAEWKAEWHNEDEKEPEWTDEETVRDKLSADLAEQLMDACADGFGMWSRFPEVQNTAVLNTDMISCTIYMGYLTYEYDLERVTEQVNQSKSAEAMGKVILEFLKTRCPLRTPEPKPVSVEDLVDGYDPSAYTQKDHSQDSDSSDDYDDEE